MGKISLPVPGEHKLKFAMIDPRDVAGAAATILLLPKEKLSKFLALGRVQVHGPEVKSFGDMAAVLSKACGKEITVNQVPPDAWAAALVGYGMTEYFASSFKETVQICAGEMEPQRPHSNENHPLLLEVWKPKYTADDWSRDHAAAFS